MSEPLPHWAVSRSNKEDIMEVGTQLFTKDGSKVGNAFIYKTYFSDRQTCQVSDVMTDIGNIIEGMNINEIRERFTVGDYILNVEEAYSRRVTDKTHCRGDLLSSASFDVNNFSDYTYWVEDVVSEHDAPKDEHGFFKGSYTINVIYSM